jgi:hypothetical protein
MDIHPTLSRLLGKAPGEARTVIAIVAAFGVVLFAVAVFLFYMDPREVPLPAR